MRLPALLTVLLTLTACATPTAEERIRTRLVDAGIARPVAGCMAERMVDRLSVAQLRKLQSLGKLSGDAIGRMTIDELVQRLRALGDPEIVTVVTRVGVGCAIAG